MSLPLILAGPILRRVDGEVCSAWVALSRPATVGVTLWAGTQMSTGPGTVASGDAPLASGQVQTRRFGANLHIALVTIDLKGPPAVALAPGSLHSYDITIDGTASLRTEGLLKDEVAGTRLANVDTGTDAGDGSAGFNAPLHLALGYDTDRLPSFVTPGATIESLRMAHASCRRSNAGGYDAMAWLDDFIKANKLTPAERPQQLYLTGDQIYADDLGTALLPMLTRLGAELLGGVEKFPVSETAGQEFELNVDKFPPQRRGLIVREKARFSTTDSRNHLLGFGEFAAMYCAAWSSRVWQALGNEFSTFVDFSPDNADTAAFLSKPETEVGGTLAKWKADPDHGLASIERETKQVRIYRDAVPKAARALANCITYMIWDDHEVTDDWNLTGRWLSRVYSKRPGQAIIRNGMIAYGLFQGWGNDPKAFAADGNNKDFLTEAESIFAGNGPFPSGATNRMDEILGFPGAAADKRAKWHYRVDGPRHRTLVLDTRTRRDTGNAASTKPPKLLGGTLGDQVPDGPLTDGRELLVVVSAAPVLGPTLFDKVFQPLTAAIKDTSNAIGKMLEDAPYNAAEELKQTVKYTDGDEHRDVEGWAADEGHQEALLKKLGSYPRVVILSGDVHFSCSMTLDYWKGTTPTPSRIVQLTSSGARNGWPIKIESQFRKNTVFQDLLGGVLVERLAWTGPAKITVPAGSHISPGRRGRMKRSPALLPVLGWPAGTTIDTAPDWRWRLKLVRDTRTGGQNGAPPDPPPLATDINPGASFAGYVGLAKRHAVATMTMPRLLRTLMFLSNIGLVSFRDTGGTVTLTHRLLSASAPSSQTFAVNTLHEASLAPSTEAPPTLLTN